MENNVFGKRDHVDKNNVKIIGKMIALILMDNYAYIKIMNVL